MHRAAEDEQRVGNWRRRLRAGSPDGELAEDARSGVRLVDYGEDSHSGVT
jgi:hypothetical protein